MSRFKMHSPDQAYLLPPSVRDELGPDHLCFFIREVIERLAKDEPHGCRARFLRQRGDKFVLGTPYS